MTEDTEDGDFHFSSMFDLGHRRALYAQLAALTATAAHQAMHSGKTLKIARKLEDAEFIDEAAVDHNGDMKLVRILVRLCKDLKLTEETLADAGVEVPEQADHQQESELALMRTMSEALEEGVIDTNDGCRLLATVFAKWLLLNEADLEFTEQMLDAFDDGVSHVLEFDAKQKAGGTDKTSRVMQ
jgi:hypothetical protein